MKNIISEAISEKARLTVSYPPGTRVIEPHAFGYSKDGHPLLRAYQVSGASSSGEHEHWKLFRLDRIGGVDPEGSSFTEARPGYRRDNKAMKGGIISQL